MKYTYNEVKAMIEKAKANGFLILESENDILPQVGRKLMEAGYELIAEPSSPDSYCLKIIWDRLSMAKYFKKDKPITHEELVEFFKELQKILPFYIDFEKLIYKY